MTDQESEQRARENRERIRRLFRKVLTLEKPHPIFGEGYTNEDANEAAEDFKAVTD